MVPAPDDLPEDHLTPGIPAAFEVQDDTPPAAIYNAALDAVDTGDYDTAIRYYTIAAERDYGAAMNNLAYLYYMQDGYMDDEKAFYWYEKGAAAGNPNAINGLSLCYQYGVGTAHDIEKGFHYLHLAADKGLAGAHNNLGVLYHDEQQYEKAFHHFEEAARLGDPDNGWLGVFYLNGIVVEKDVSKAIEYFNKAIEKGDQLAHIELAGIYLEEEGFKDRALAAKHISEAEKAGIDIPDEFRI